MDRIIMDTRLEVRNKVTWEQCIARLLIHRPAGDYGLVHALIMIDTEFGTVYEAYKPTQSEALNRIREQMTDWERV